MIPASEALERLRDGNSRFLSGHSNIDESLSAMKRVQLVDGQSPFAIILACSDSRVPVELVFDQGLGDLFVIRVAGNIVAPSQVSSVEFAAAQLGTRLVVVLGHSNCSAVEATLKELQREQAHRSPNLRAIVDRIRPAVEPLLEKNGDIPLNDAVTANVRHAVDRLRHGSQLLEDLTAAEKLTIVGAEYSIESGKVEFLGSP
jgi:carbonic anhydrase